MTAAKAYVVSLIDADTRAIAAITNELTHNQAHYNLHGMALPAGAVTVHSIRIIRIG